MATDVAVLIARLEADVKDFDKDLKKASKRLGKLEDYTKKTGKATDTMKGSMAGLGKMMGVVFAGAAAAGVFRFFKSTIDASSDLNESINAVNVVFEESAEGVKKLGENAAQSMGLANAEFNTLAVSFSSFVEKIVGPGGDVVGTLEDLTQRASDFASVMNIDVVEAATIFRSGLAGETEPLRKFGLDLSAAAVTAQALADGLADSSSKLTEQDKVLTRYKLIMKQTEKTSGDFENTSGDFANAMRILAAEFENAKAKLGDALIPELEKLIPIAREAVDIMVEMAPAVGAAGESFGTMLENMLPILETAGFLVVKWNEFNENNDKLIASDNPFDRLVGGVTKLFTGPALSGAINMFKDLFGLNADVVVENLLNVAGASRTAGRFSRTAADSGVKPLAKELTAVEKAAKNAKKEVETYISVVQGMVDPALAAVNSLIDLEEAQAKVAELSRLGKEDTDEFRLAQLELAAQVFETEAALREFDGGDVERAIDLIALALGKSSEEARTLLEDLGLLDGLEVTAVINLEGRGGFAAGIREAERIVASAPRNIIRHQGGLVPGPPGADVPIIAQAGEMVIPAAQVSGGAGGGDMGGLTINIDGDVTEAVLEDIQRELILESVGRLVETR